MLNSVQRHDEHTVYATAIPSTHAHQYCARVMVVKAGEAVGTEVVIFNDDSLDGGRVWSSSDAALAYALDVGAVVASTHAAFGTFSISDFSEVPEQSLAPLK